MKRAAFVVNPSKCTDIEIVKKLVAAAPGWTDPTYFETTADDPGHGAAKRALGTGSDLIVICGGDGTVTACLGVLAGSGVPVAIVPCGTGNLLARNLKIPLGVDDAMEAALTGEDLPIDLGDLDGEPFAVMAGIGFDAAMLADANDTLKQRVGWPAYVVSAARHLRDRPVRVELRPSDGPPLHRRAASVIVANVGQLQGKLPLLPDASPDDGLLDVLIIAPRGFGGWLRVASAVVLRRRDAPMLDRLQVTEIEIVAQRTVRCERDGEVVPSRRRLRVRVSPSAVVVRRPRQ